MSKQTIAFQKLLTILRRIKSQKVLALGDVEFVQTAILYYIQPKLKLYEDKTNYTFSIDFAVHKQHAQWPVEDLIKIFMNVYFGTRQNDSYIKVDDKIKCRDVINNLVEKIMITCNLHSQPIFERLNNSLQFKSTYMKRFTAERIKKIQKQRQANLQHYRNLIVRQSSKQDITQIPMNKDNARRLSNTIDVDNEEQPNTDI